MTKYSIILDVNPHEDKEKIDFITMQSLEKVFIENMEEELRWYITDFSKYDCKWIASSLKVFIGKPNRENYISLLDVLSSLLDADYLDDISLQSKILQFKERVYP